GSCAELNPLVAKARPNAARDHRIEHVGTRFVADTVQQIAAQPHFLDGCKVAALVVDAGQPVAGELLRNVGNAILTAPVQLRRRKRGPTTDIVENAACPARYSSVEIALLIAVVGPTG